MKLLSICLSFIDNEAEHHKFEKLYWKYKNLLYYCAGKRLDDEKLVEDAVSNAFLYVAQNMQMIGDVESTRTRNLLAMIADRAAINLYKKQQREYSRTVSVEEVTDMAQKSNMELAYQTKEAMKQLPEEYQQVMILRYAEGYTNREIALILDYTVAKVDKMMSRARKQLAGLLEEA
ncbi:MAG: sigma-70 family RNA polymerase sigma factor [Peptococcaceae bacterium]|nr:sigma-70 family RNA polymerase sigma factor [Peptococcaceae bacterium]